MNPECAAGKHSGCDGRGMQGDGQISGCTCYCHTVNGLPMTAAEVELARLLGCQVKVMRRAVLDDERGLVT